MIKLIKTKVLSIKNFDFICIGKIKLEIKHDDFPSFHVLVYKDGEKKYARIIEFNSVIELFDSDCIGEKILKNLLEKLDFFKIWDNPKNEIFWKYFLDCSNSNLQDSFWKAYRVISFKIVPTYEERSIFSDLVYDKSKIKSVDFRNCENLYKDIL